MDFEEIYRTHKNRVYNLALQYVQNAEDAQEITQDVFVSVHKSIEGFKAQSTLSTWIYRITINHSLDYLKARKRKKRFGFLTSLFYDDSTEIRFDSATFDHPGVELEQKEALERLFTLINELPDNQKTTLILSRIEQKSHAEIAEIMNLSLKAVESLVQRAKVNLAKKLKSSEGS